MKKKQQAPLTPDAYLAALKEAMVQARMLSREELITLEKSTRIFRSARAMSSLTQEELKYTSTQMISKIENGKRIPTPDEVLDLAKTTGNPTLLGYYCTVYCSLNYIPPEHQMRVFGIEEAKEQMALGFQSLENGITQLLEVLQDSRVEEEEFSRFFSALSTLKQISNAIHGLRNWAVIHHLIPLTLDPQQETGIRLADLRNEAKETQETVAELVGISRPALVAMERDFDANPCSLPQKDSIRNRFNLLADHYHAPALYETFCRCQCPIGQCSRLPHWKDDLADIACGFLAQVLLLQQEQVLSSLREILEDNVVGREEEEDFLASMNRLKTFCDYTDSMIHYGQRYLTSHLRIYMQAIRRGDFLKRPYAERCLRTLKALGYSKKYTEKHYEEIQKLIKKKEKSSFLKLWTDSNMQ